jgi:hypothetical protein
MKKALFVAILSLLALWLCLAVAFGQAKPGSGEHVVNLEGYCELAEAVLLKKMDKLQDQIDFLESRVTALEEAQ